MKTHGVEAPEKVRAPGAVDLPTIQRYLNFHYSVTLDLFGADQSSNAAMFFSSGLKGRYEEAKRGDDHVLKDRGHTILDVENGRLVEREIPMLNALERGAARRLHPRFDLGHRSLEQGDRQGRPPLRLSSRTRHSIARSARCRACA